MGPRYRYVVLAVGTAAQAATAAYFLGLAAVTPALRDHFGLGVAGVGALLGGISVGLVGTLIAWGSAADRYGERGHGGRPGRRGRRADRDRAVRDPLVAGGLLVLAGASGASVNAASGRAVLTWFPQESRGMAMAVRQTSVPIGTALAAVALPPVAAAAGIPAVLLTLAATCLVTALAVAVCVREPPGRAASGARPAASTISVLSDRRLLRLSSPGCCWSCRSSSARCSWSRCCTTVPGCRSHWPAGCSRSPGARRVRPAGQRRVVGPGR
ncbi:hypothetical protein BJF78_28200 [Pseudonocardia sp. CNS-139]|nr:hypothetical protein BJF78_28200 [Pseudonocardia sp. CNS-139]